MMSIFQMKKLRVKDVNNYLINKLAYLQTFDHLPFLPYSDRKLEKYVG